MKPLLFILTALFYSTTLPAQDRVSGKNFATRSVVMGQNGMAATNHPYSTLIALDILKAGGNAIDAAIAANAFLGLADFGDCGVGGDLFAIVWDAESEKLYGLNASGRSPRNMSLEYLQAENEKGNYYYEGPLSVTVPGCVEGWFELHKKFGETSMEKILAPTIRYAKEGIPITQEIAHASESYGQSYLDAKDNPSFKALYTHDGRYYREGEIFKNPDLAGTLETIAKEGRDGFYKGTIAQTMVEHLQKRGGKMTLEDLAENKAEWVDPVSVNYRGYEVWEMPPNGQGMGALQMLTILEGFDIGAMGFGSTEHVHHFLEAKKLAYEDMMKFYGDPAFSEIPIKRLLSEEYAAQRREQIKPDKAGIYHPGIEIRGNTIYLTVADKQGNMISLIQSNSAYFGSGEAPPGLGFVLQNRGGGFKLEEGHPNTYAPGKRPFHTIIPAFITKDGEPFMSFGLMGGDMQTQGHVQMVMNVIDFGMNIQEAGDAPRIYHRGIRHYTGHLDNVGTAALETGYDYETIRELMRMGHRIIYEPGVFGGYQAIMRKEGIYYGASESRKDGMAAGY